MRFARGKLGAGILGLLAAGCSNFSTLQTARVLQPGKFRVHLGGGAFSSNQLSSVVSSSSSTASNQSLVFPYVEFSAGLGLGRRFDASAKYTAPGSISLAGKFQFIDTKSFAMAVGAQAGYLPIVVNSTTANLLDLGVPLYASVDFADWIGLYGSVRYQIRMQLGTNPSTTPFFAFGGGIRIGNAVGLLAEVTSVRQTNSTFRGVQFCGAFFFGNAQSVETDEGKTDKDTSRRRASQVFDTQDYGKFLRVTHDDIRPWREGESVCAIASNRAEVACGTVIKTDSVSATVRVSRRRGKVAPGMEVIARP